MVLRRSWSDYYHQSIHRYYVRGDINRKGFFIRLSHLKVLVVFLLGWTSYVLISLSTTVVGTNMTTHDPSVVLSSQRLLPPADKGPILDLLRMANVVDLNEQEYEALPSWDQVKQRIGKEPRFIGLETCEEYRTKVPWMRRQVAPAGMFSTGTNLLQHLLRENCHDESKANSRRFVGWQVNWGKHQSPRFRHINYITRIVRNNSFIFPVVLVRDPWTWLQSMCRVRYSAHWFHGT